MNVFSKDLGIHQGRVRRTDGAHVYELGHALLAELNVEVGDYHEVAQDIVFEPGSQLLTVVGRIAMPPVDRVPTSRAWVFSISLAGVRKFVRRLHESKRAIALDDVRISLRGLAPGAHRLVFRLELV